MTAVPGTFAWAELAASALEPALRFYADLLAWTPVDRSLTTPAGERIEYRLLQLGERPVASAYGLVAAQREQGLRPHWLPYVAVEDASRAARAAEDLGAVLVGSTYEARVFGSGTCVLVDDPGGARIALWQPGSGQGFQLSSDPGAACWFELRTPDPEASAGFYAALLGWERDSAELGGEPYALWRRGERLVGGLAPAGSGDRARWVPYFSVEDCSASARRAEELGGALRVAPRDAGGFGRFAAVEDPEGAGFSLLELAERPRPEAAHA